MKFKFTIAVFSFFFAFSGLANASVVMTGTRIVFPSSTTERTIQFNNPDSQPYIIQLQMTEESGKLNNSPPFYLVPPVFRMEPHTGQSVRLIYNGQALPMDRESIFYLDFTQLPALDKSKKSNNQLVIAIRNRVKVFYRPDSLIGSPGDAYQALVFSIKQGKLNIENPTGFYISVRKAEVSIDGQNLKLADTVMLAPKSTSQWVLPNKISTLNNAKLKLILVNDYGVDVKRERAL